MSQNDQKSDAPAPSFLPQSGDETGVRILKIVVLALGVLLVLGVGVMLARLAYVISRPKESKAPADVPALRAPIQNGVPENIQVPPGAVVSSMAMSDEKLAVHMTFDGQSMIIIYDISSGRAVQRLKLP